jgi:anti-anti-sigma factor
MNLTEIFAIERADDVILLVPRSDLRELDYQRIESGAREVLQLLEQESIKKVLLDFSNTDYYGSTALAFFVKLWKRIKVRQGQLAFCNVSAHEKEILKITGLDRLWPICSTRAEGLRILKNQGAP